MAVELVYNIFSLKQFDFFSNWFDKQVLFFETGVCLVSKSLNDHQVACISLGSWEERAVH